MAKRKKLYEGKAKILYSGPKKGTIIQYFKDDATAFNAQKHTVIDGKGVLNNRLSEFFMSGLEEVDVKTHFIKRLNVREQLVKFCIAIPIEVVVRNYAAGSLCTRIGLKEGTKLKRPLTELYLKNDELGDPLVTEDHIMAGNWASQFQLDEMTYLAVRINDFLVGMAYSAGLRLVDLKLEFGRYWDGEYEDIILIDEISPDSCRLWDFDTGQKFDKDVFRHNLGSLSEAYMEVARRFGVLPVESQDYKNNPKLLN